MSDTDAQAHSLTPADVRKVAKLARLELSEAQVEQYRTQLSAVLGYVRQLRELDVSGVEPMSHPIASSNRLADDVPGPTLTNTQLIAMAPDAFPPFIKVPKVLDGGSGA